MLIDFMIPSAVSRSSNPLLLPFAAGFFHGPVGAFAPKFEGRGAF